MAAVVNVGGAPREAWPSAATASAIATVRVTDWIMARSPATCPTCHSSCLSALCRGFGGLDAPLHPIFCLAMLDPNLSAFLVHSVSLDWLSRFASGRHF